MYLEASKKKTRNVRNLGKDTAVALALLQTRKASLGRSLLLAVCAGRALVRVLTSWCISGSTLGRNPLSVTSVGRPLFRVQTLLCISESTRDRNPMFVPNVGKPSLRVQT